MPPFVISLSPNLDVVLATVIILTILDMYKTSYGIMIGYAILAYRFDTIEDWFSVTIVLLVFNIPRLVARAPTSSRAL